MGVELMEMKLVKIEKRAVRLHGEVLWVTATSDVYTDLSSLFFFLISSRMSDSDDFQVSFGGFDAIGCTISDVAQY